MDLRILQVALPDNSDDRMKDVIENRTVLGRWRDEEFHRSLWQLVVPADETEAVMDDLDERFGKVDGFSVVLVPIGAMLPRPSEDEAADEAKVDSEADQHPNRVSREELYHQLEGDVVISRVFLGMTVLSTIVAVVGLLQNRGEVVIGAMVIAPLLGPNVATALATILGDGSLFRRSLITNALGVGVTFGLAVIAGMLFEVDTTLDSIASRTDVGIGDILLALAAGSAGTLAFTRGLSGAVVGVMVAVALVPPLVTSGLLFGDGHYSKASEALLLSGANVVCINLAGIMTFLIQGVRPRTWEESERAKAGTLKACAVWGVLLLLVFLMLWLTGRSDDEFWLY